MKIHWHQHQLNETTTMYTVSCTACQNSPMMFAIVDNKPCAVCGYCGALLSSKKLTKALALKKPTLELDSKEQ